MVSSKPVSGRWSDPKPYARFVAEPLGTREDFKRDSGANFATSRRNNLLGVEIDVGLDCLAREIGLITTNPLTRIWEGLRDLNPILGKNIDDPGAKFIDAAC